MEEPLDDKAFPSTAPAAPLKPLPLGTTRLCTWVIGSVILWFGYGTAATWLVPDAKGWSAVFGVIWLVILAVLNVFALHFWCVPRGMGMKQFVQTWWRNNVIGNYEVFQHDGYRLRIFYRGPRDTFGERFTDKLIHDKWAVAFPLGGWFRRPLVLDATGWSDRRWTVRIRTNSRYYLNITDCTGVTLPRSLDWFLQFLDSFGRQYHPEYGEANASWLDALDGLTTFHREQAGRIEELNEQIDNLQISLDQRTRDLTKEEAEAQQLFNERNRLASAIQDVITRLLKSKRFGRIGGQNSIEAMQIRKKLFSVLRGVLGADDPTVKSLETLQDTWQARGPKDRTSGEAVQRTR